MCGVQYAIVIQFFCDQEANYGANEIIGAIEKTIK
jgi:hypothetical protein